MSEQHETEDTIGEVPPSTKNAELQEGTHIDRYQILGLLGKGGMGAVYKAYDPELDRSIAIKILTATPQAGETASRPLARLMREAQALAKLSHPNVVSVFDVGTYDEGVYIAMEYVKGKTLREWLRDEQPTQTEIMGSLQDAGKGLHAAHAEGIVHRDFKPDNVIVGDRGQVKVLDFGLARAAGTEDTLVSPEEKKPAEDSTSGEKLLSKPLTRVGAIVGTAVYMAPEHFHFDALDEKTDQYSFCVTLFEALYGKRPFWGRTSKELEKNITSRRIEIPREANVPKWIEGIILKGLSGSKSERFGSMRELLDALGNDPEIIKSQRRKKQRLGLAFVMGAVTFLGIGYLLFSRSSELCTGADKKLAGVWSADRKEEVKQSFAKTGLSYADNTLILATKRLEDYLGDWKKEFTETCEATRVRGERSEEFMDLKMGCLYKHLRSVAALVEVFREADKTIVSKSVQAVSSLSSLSNCNDARALQSRILLPKDEPTQNKVAAIRETLAKVEALGKTGKYKEGLELAKWLEGQAGAVDFRLIQAEVLYWLGELLERTGKYKKAEQTLFKSEKAAGESRDPLLAAKAMVKLVAVVGDQQARFAEGLLLARDAEAMLNVSGGDVQTRANLLNNMGGLFYSKGDYDKALRYYREALGFRSKVLGPQHPEVARTLNNMGATYYNLGEYDQALQCYQKTMAIQKKVFGSNHPDLAYVLNNIGNVLRELGEYNEAIAYLLKALEFKIKMLGPEHPVVASTLNNLGFVFLGKKEFSKALDHLQRALAVWEKTLGSEHPILVYPLSGIGSVLADLDRPHKSLQALERAAAICEKKACEPEAIGRVLFAVSRGLSKTGGDRRRATRLAIQARDIFSKTPKAFKKDLAEVDAWLKKNARKGKDLSLAKHGPD